MTSRDRTQRFLFEEADIRGEIVQLDHSFREITDVHQYAPGVNKLLGEFLAAAVLLATTLKFEASWCCRPVPRGRFPC